MDGLLEGIAVDVTRRGFLCLLSAVAATAAMPVPSFVLAEPAVAVPSMPVVLGEIRVIAASDIDFDLWLVRLDAFNGRDQFGVDFMVADCADMRPKYLQARDVAEQVLRENLLHEGWRASDLIALPIPPGYKEPAWMSA